MNLVSTLVGLSIAGISSPMLMDMSLAPVIAQKRASNFGIAEAAAVTYAAANEGATELTEVPNRCTRDDSNAPAFTIRCERGENQFIQTVSRSFIANPNSAGNGDTTRTFSYPPPPGYTGHQCHPWEQWGTNSPAFSKVFNEWNGNSCNPPILFGNDSTKYHASDPNSWLYDVNNYAAWGIHTRY